jgi:hypothetical protein
VAQAVAGSKPAHQVFLFLVEVGRHDQADRLSDRLSLRVPEDPLGGSIPGNDRPVEVIADDRIGVRCHDRKPERSCVVGL